MNSLNILPFETRDLLQIKALQPEGWPDITPHWCFYDSSPQCFPIKVVKGQKIIGLGTSIVHTDSAWLAHIIVHPEYRNQGIGRKITQHLIHSLNHLPTIYLIATDLGAPVYLKLDFEVETEYVFYKDISGMAGQDALKYVRPYSTEFKEDVLLLDREATGEHRSALLESHLADALVYLEGDNPTGVYIPTLGEGLILARTEKAGTGLMRLRFDSKDTTVFPVDNVHAHRLMQEQAFSELRRAKRMRLGTKKEMRPELIYSRIGGNLG